MYCKHFGLSQQPFKITPETYHFYVGGNRGAILDALVYTVLNGEGIIKVVGEVGSGKTMLCRMLEIRLPKNVEVVYLNNPGLSPDDILPAIALELNLSIPKDSGKFVVLKTLEKYLLNKHAQNYQVVVFIEEAQNMPLETLEEIRLLTNLETQQYKLIQIVLFGQPELDIHLADERIRQLRDRITHSFNLPPLTNQDIKNYVMFRLQSAGCRSPNIFSASAIKKLTKSSGGLMRRINILADKALLSAYIKNDHLITAKHVGKAVLDSEFSRKRRWPKSLLLIPVAVLLVFAIVAIAIPGADRLFTGRISDSLIDEQKEENGHSIVSDMPSNSPVDSSNNLEQTTDYISAAPLKQSHIIDESINDLIDKTMSWLPNADGRKYSIQVMVAKADSKKEIVHFLQTNTQNIELDKIFIFRSLVNSQPKYVVIYDEFTSYGRALMALEKMPLGLKRYKPYVRTIKQLQSEALEKLPDVGKI